MDVIGLYPGDVAPATEEQVIAFAQGTYPTMARNVASDSRGLVRTAPGFIYVVTD